MIFRNNPKNGQQISSLAFGCMRFTKDEKELTSQIKYAIDNGVNYFDTAYIYPGSEVTLGRVLASLGYRDKVNIATKLPPYLVHKYEDFDKLFNTQLSRLQTDHIDFYMIHMLTEIKSWQALLDKGVLKWVQEKKASGAIKSFGFSFHGIQEEFTKIVDAYDWDFCMIQYNYLDENSQAGKSGLKLAAAKGMPVMIMEPLRGGRLAGNLPKDANSAINAAAVKRSPAEWSFKWIWNHPEVTTVLSGMNTMDMIKENIRVASETQPNSMSTDDLAVVEKLRTSILAATKVPCTGCAYCMPCPKGVDIPMCLSSYNDTQIHGGIVTKFHYIMRTNKHNASLCTKCGKCVKHCPQKIAIPQELANAAKALEGGIYKPVRGVVRKFMKLEK